MGHLKRHNAPVFWPIKRKGIIWTVKPSPGPHALNKSIPLLILVRDILKLGSTAREARSIIRQGKITVDKKVRKDPKFPIGLMDIVEIPEIGKHMRVVMGNHGIKVADIHASESAKKTCRIEGKTTTKNGVTQLNLHDGRNLLVESNEYKPGDSLLISIPEQDIVEHFKFEENAPVVVTGGKNTGFGGKLETVMKRETVLQKNRVIVSAGDNKIETLKKFVIVIGKAGESTSPNSDEEAKTKKKSKGK